MCMCVSGHTKDAIRSFVTNLFAYKKGKNIRAEKNVEIDILEQFLLLLQTQICVYSSNTTMSWLILTQSTHGMPVVTHKCILKSCYFGFLAQLNTSGLISVFVGI